MYAGVSYEPMLYNLMCREPVELDLVAMLKSTFGPLTTARGAVALDACLVGLDRPKIEHDAPATLHEFMHYGQQTEDRQQTVSRSIEDLRAAAAAYWAARRDRAQT